MEQTNQPTTKRSVGQKIVWGTVIFLFVALLGAIALPNFGAHSRVMSSENACINNLRQLDGAKQQWAIENKMSSNSVPRWEDVLPYLKQKPVCPKQGTYTLNSVAENPQCSVAEHKLPTQ